MKDGWCRRHSRQLEVIRPLIYTIAATNRDPKKSFPSIQDFMPLLTDVAIDEDSEAVKLQKMIDEKRAYYSKRKGR